MTYRERREARADRLEEWAQKREAKAAAVFEANRPFTSDHAFNTQPGHIPLRARVIAQEDRAFESLQKAERMASRAAGIRAQMDESIYSDDEDAVERLRERIAALEAKREHIKATNAAYRKAHKVELAALTPYGRNQAMPFPAYVLQNLTGNIARNKKRLAHMERKTS